MNDIFAFFENFDMPVLAADQKSGKTVYINKAAAFLTDNSIILTEAEKNELKLGEFLHRTFFSKPLGRTIETETTLIILDGKTLVFEIQNLSASSWADSAFCAAMQAEEPSHAPHIMLEKAGNALKAERMYICEKTAPDSFVRSCEWTAPNAVRSRKLPLRFCTYLYNELSHIDCIVIDSKNAAETTLCDFLSEREIHSFAAIPLFEGEKVNGFCCAENFPDEMCKSAVETLRQAAFFIGICIKWSRLFADLKKMSLTDQLTGIGNRHAMNTLESGLKTPTPLGIVFCDISGLKQINDTLGHCAGDDYIISACEIMK
ncbi:MAG: diguanylate cyclase domain-containing protein, partial [Oscillospiraceae bacterium]